MYVLLAGNPADGVRVIGTFERAAYAAEWADEWIDGLDWWVVPLTSTGVMENEIKENQLAVGE